jgi:hypothetical protein
LTPQKRPSLTAFNFLVVMAVESMLRRANGAQAGIQRLHDQALVGAERSRVGIRLGLLAFSKPDDDTGTNRGEIPSVAILPLKRKRLTISGARCIGVKNE